MIISSVARGNIDFTSSSHIWFGSLEFIITWEGHDLDLIPPTDEPASLPKPAVDLRRRSNKLNTWPNEFSLPGLPQAAQPYHDKKLHSASTNVYHLNSKVGEVLEDLPQ
jgi:hypothetical protein